jgi:hypothetical protein
VKLIKTIGKVFLWIFVFIIIALVLQYVVNPKYDFPEPKAFHGDYIYNPYSNIDSLKWEKGNFHVHTRAYYGVTNGKINSNKYLDSLYRYFEYGVIGISDYQKINRYESPNKWFVPEYEHGYQYYKTHQLVLNASKVSWLDYFFYQTLNNKQFIINQLKKDPNIILTIPHPFLRQAYTFEEFRRLSNYNCLEICNNERVATVFYDVILSAGRPVFLMADDDAHDLTKLKEGIHSFNLINSDLVKDSILKAIKTGRLIGVNFNISSFKTNEEKKAALQKLPGILSITLQKDTISVRLSNVVNSIKFIGQDGVEMKKTANSSGGSYFFRKEDTYIRTEIECNDGTIYYLNPFFRYNGEQLTDYTPAYNFIKTWIWRLITVIILLSIIYIVRKIRK